MRCSSPSKIFSLVFLLIWADSCGAAAENRTIDDTLGDSVSGDTPAYGNSEGPWIPQPGCTTCSLTGVDTSQVFDGTWHENTFTQGGPRMNFNISFTGSAIWVFNILPNSMATKFGYTTTLQFFLDGVLDRNFTYTPDNTTPYLYQYPVYQRAVKNGSHSLEMTVPPDAPTNAVILFDYIAYTFDDPDVVSEPTTSPSVVPTSPPSNSAQSSTPSGSPTTQSGSSSSSTTTLSPPSAITNTSIVSSGDNALSSSPTSTSQTSASPSAVDSNSSTRITKKKPHLGIAIGVAIAGFLVICGLGYTLWVFCRRRRHLNGAGASAAAAESGPSSHPAIVDPFFDPAELYEAMGVAPLTIPARLQRAYYGDSPQDLIRSAPAAIDDPSDLSRSPSGDMFSPSHNAGYSSPETNMFSSDSGSGSAPVGGEITGDSEQAAAALRVAAVMQHRMNLLEADVQQLREQQADQEPLPLYPAEEPLSTATNKLPQSVRYPSL